MTDKSQNFLTSLKPTKFRSTLDSVLKLYDTAHVNLTFTFKWHLSSDSVVTSIGQMPSNLNPCRVFVQIKLLTTIYNFILKFSLASCSLQLGLSGTNKINHDIHLTNTIYPV